MKIYYVVPYQNPTRYPRLFSSRSKAEEWAKHLWVMKYGKDCPYSWEEYYSINWSIVDED